jgi:predicted transcriptional regulator
MPPDHQQLSDLQLAVMRALWDRGEATAADVHTDLAQTRELAPTTVATMLSRLEKKGLVAHRTEGRMYVYRAEVEETTVRRSMTSRVTDLFFGGNPAALVSHLVDEGEIEPGDLQELKALIQQLESKEDSHG